MSGRREAFHVRIEGEARTRRVRVRGTVYRDVAAAVPAILGIYPPVTVTIWVPRLVKAGYGPYTYRVEEDAYGRLFVQQMIEVPAPAEPAP